MLVWCKEIMRQQREREKERDREKEIERIYKKLCASDFNAEILLTTFI
jgi:hypothetical protein